MPFALSDPSQGEDLAARQIAVGTPTHFEENLSAAFDASRLNDRFIGEQSALADEYERYNEDTFRTTGISLPNPIHSELPPGVTKMDFTGDPRIPLPTDQAIRMFEEFARKQGANPPSADEFRDRAHARMTGVEQTRADVAARGAGASAGFGQFLGSAGAIMTDPPMLESMLFGGGEAATMLGAMGREALVSGATEALVQPQIQAGRVRAGLPGGFEQGATNVALAAGGAAALTGAFRGAAAAYRTLRGKAIEFQPRTAAETDSARYTERYADLQSHNPLAETPDGASEHVERVSAAQRRLYEPGADTPEARLRDEPNNPVRRDRPAPTPPELPDDVPAAATALSLGQKLAADARVSASGLDDFKAARSVARELGDLDDESINIARGPAPVEPRSDQSLVQFIIAKGGISDADRSLASIGVTPRLRPGLIRRSGLSASQMSELAAEAGYFPPALAGEGSRVVDQRELATAVSDELGGQKLYARYREGDVDARANFEAQARIHEDLTRAFQDLGISPRRLTNAQVRDAVRSIADTPDPISIRADHEAEAIDRAKAADSDLDWQIEREERLAIQEESRMREVFAGREDELIYFEANGETHTTTARELFRTLDDDERLVAEFTKCVEVEPF